MDNRQATRDERDNRRVFAWGILAAIVIMLGTLAYFHAVQKRFEAPVQIAPAQSESAPAEAPATTPAK